MKDRDISEKLEKKSPLLVRTDPENHFSTIIDTVRKLQEKGYKGVYLSFQRPSKNLRKMFKKEGLENQDIRIVDLATKLEGKEHEEREKTVFLNPETDIYHLNREVYNQMKKLEGEKKFLILDSLDTPVLYRPPEEILKLTEFIVMLRDFDNEIKIVFNTSKDPSKKQILKHISEKMEEIVK